MSKIQNIVFDMGNVLIRYTPEAYASAYLSDPEDIQCILDELFHNVEWVAMDRGTLTEKEAMRSIAKRLPEHLHAVAARLIREWHQDIPPYPEMDQLIHDLKAAGYGIYLLSNTSKRYHEFRVNIPAIDLFDGEFISADHGLLKPDRAMYQAFFEQFHLEPETCFFIDDSAANIESAMREGMQGFVFHGNVAKVRRALNEAGVDF